jgi:hypothetical protein
MIVGLFLKFFLGGAATTKTNSYDGEWVSGSEDME